MGPLPGTSQNSFPYSISGFIAEPSQSAQRPRANPAAVQSVTRLRDERDDGVCSFLRISQDRSVRFCHQRAVRLMALNGDAGRAFSFSALSSNSSGSRPFKPRDAGAIDSLRSGPCPAPAGAPFRCASPVRAAIFLKEAPVLDPRPESALPYRIRMKPAGGPSPAGAEFTCARVA